MKFIDFLYRNVLGVWERYGMESRFQQKALDWEVQGPHKNPKIFTNRRIRNRTYGGVRGRRAQALLLLDQPYFIKIIL